MSNYGDDNRGRRRQRDRRTDVFPHSESALPHENDWQSIDLVGVHSIEAEDVFTYGGLPAANRHQNITDQLRRRSRSADYYRMPILGQQRSRSTDYGSPVAGNIGYQRPKSIDFQRSDTLLYRDRQQPRNIPQGFQHYPLSFPEQQKRLIKVLPHVPGSPIRCVICHVDHGMNTWTAVSYTWGVKQASAPILVGYLPDQSDAKPLLVTKNLYDILLHISRMRTSGLHQKRWNGWWWIDALCIIQDDKHPEKDVQIKSMPKFYKKASEVFAWIGPGDQTTDDAMRYIREQPSTFRDAVIRGFADAHLTSFEDTFHRVARSVRAIFSSPYWTRLWILQELAMSPNTTLICGSEELSWNTFIDFAIQVAAADFGPDSILRKARREIVGKQPVWLLTRIIQRRRRKPNLAELVFLSKDAECGRDKKDYIRALLGMVGTGWGTTVDPEKHKSACSIISHATRAIIQDMKEDRKIPQQTQDICEAIARLAHHDPLILEKEKERANCANYEDALAQCRSIAVTLYQHKVLMRSRIEPIEETWDFEQNAIRRRRSRSGSRSSLASRGRSRSRSRSRSRNRSGRSSRHRSRAGSRASDRGRVEPWDRPVTPPVIGRRRSRIRLRGRIRSRSRSRGGKSESICYVS